MMQMTSGEQVTGTRDERYNLVSVLYHALQAGETTQQYIQDAEKAATRSSSASSSRSSRRTASAPTGPRTC